jgi:ubiquinone/menaquinone biosynthesis C-methylase UbiE
MFDEVYGVDVVPWAVKRAAENCPQGKFYTYDGKTLPFTDGFFDAVVSWTVFQHIPPVEIGGVFDEVARVSVVDSVLVVYENVTRADDKAHVWFRGEGFYVNCFKGRGFEVLKQKLVSNFDGTGEDHALMVFRKC